MGANWAQPLITTNYVALLDELKARDVDGIVAFEDRTPSNLPTGAKRWNAASLRWERWDGTAWQSAPMVLGLSGGGTGATTAAGARNSLGASSGIWPVSLGGTGASTVTGARNNLGASSGIWPVSVGGTGASTASGARTNLGLGTVATRDVGVGSASQVPDRGDADGRYLRQAQNLSDVGDAATARANIGADNAGNLNAGTLARARLSGSNGIQVATGTSAYAARSIAGGTAISVSNGNGVNGNPTINFTGTEWPGVYTGTSTTNTNFPPGTELLCYDFNGQNTTGLAMPNLNSTVTPRRSASTNFSLESGTAMTGTWRVRGGGRKVTFGSGYYYGSVFRFVLVQRIS